MCIHIYVAAVSCKQITVKNYIGNALIYICVVEVYQKLIYLCPSDISISYIIHVTCEEPKYGRAGKGRNIVDDISMST